MALPNFVQAINKSPQLSASRNGHIDWPVLNTQSSEDIDAIIAVWAKQSTITAKNMVKIRLVIIFLFIYSKYSN